MKTLILAALLISAPVWAAELDPIPNVTGAATQGIKAQMGELLTSNIQLQAQVQELQRDLTIWHERALQCREQTKKAVPRK